MAEHPLVARVRRLRSRPALPGDDGAPGSPEHALNSRLRVEALERDVARLSASVDRMFWLVIGAAVVTAISRLVGV